MRHEFAISNSGRAAIKTSLLDAMGAASAALAAIPDNVVRMPTDAADAFLLVDPVLSTIHRQLLDARAHGASLEALFGGNDPMTEALVLQTSALERAYAERLAALRKKREESRRKHETKHEDSRAKNADVKTLAEVRDQKVQTERRNDSLWLWVLVAALAMNQAPARTAGPKLDAA